MNKEFIQKAYTSYWLAKVAGQSKKTRVIEEKDIVEIFRTLMSFSGKEAFALEELAHVFTCVFYTTSVKDVHILLSTFNTTVQLVENKWKLVSSVKFVK